MTKVPPSCSLVPANGPSWIRSSPGLPADRGRRRARRQHLRGQQHVRLVERLRIGVERGHPHLERLLSKFLGAHLRVVQQQCVSHGSIPSSCGGDEEMTIEPTTDRHRRPATEDSRPHTSGRSSKSQATRAGWPALAALAACRTQGCSSHRRAGRQWFGRLVRPDRVGVAVGLLTGSQYVAVRQRRAQVVPQPVAVPAMCPRRSVR